MRNIFLVFILAAFLIGCSSTSKQSKPTLAYYLLDSVQTQNSVASSQKHEVAFNTVVVSEYLSLPNLLLKNNNNEVTVANYHLWAEPLSFSIRRVVLNDIATRKPTLSLVDQCLKCESLVLHVDHFYPQENGDAVLSGRYVITRDKNNSTEHFFSLTTPLRNDGFNAAVTEMRLLLSRLSTHIADEL